MVKYRFLRMMPVATEVAISRSIQNTKELPCGSDKGLGVGLRLILGYHIRCRGVFGRHLKSLPANHVLSLLFNHVVLLDR